MHIALLPGHHHQSGGATCCAGALAGKSEYAIAEIYLKDLALALMSLGHSVSIARRADAGGTTPSFSARAANATGAEVAFELHFNAASPHASGSEVVFWGKNALSAKRAACLARAMASRLHISVHGSGLVPVFSASDRGFAAFANSSMPFFMLEPCFAGSNSADARALSTLITGGAWAPFLASAIHNSLLITA